jgi:hypothetical protein
MQPVADALRDIAAAVREVAGGVEPDPLRLLRAEEVADLLALPARTVHERAETPFGEFALMWLEAVAPRLEIGTVAKYRSVLSNHLLPQWEAWPLIGIFNAYLEIEKWVSELHEEYADSTLSSIFALFSMVMNAAAKERRIPASPCEGVRVTSGEYETDRLVATPVPVLRASMRLYGGPGVVGVRPGADGRPYGCAVG